MVAICFSMVAICFSPFYDLLFIRTKLFDCQFCIFTPYSKILIIYNINFYTNNTNKHALTIIRTPTHRPKMQLMLKFVRGCGSFTIISLYYYCLFRNNREISLISQFKTGCIEWMIQTVDRAFFIS